MSHRSNSESLEQVKCRFKEAEGLPFSELLQPEKVEHALGDLSTAFRKRIFGPAVTLWTFLSQVLSPDHSCREAVARLLAWRTAHGIEPCSADTSSYCQARQRLPLEAVKTLLRHSGHALQEQAEAAWLWKGRHVKVVDGTSVTMPDTQANQAAFPRRRNQAHGVGFPIARLVVIFSLACAAALELALGPMRGKKTGENTLLRSMMHVLEEGDVLLGDRLFDAYRDIAALRERGVDILFRMNQSRRCDFRRGRWLGTLDHLVLWKKPNFNSARLDRATYDALPDQMEIREVRFQLYQNGFRPHQIVLVTTLLDPVAYPKEDLADLYRERWHAELDLNALKTTLEMEHLRCKTPEMIQKEVWTHFLAYNLMRETMAQAAREHGALPRRLSFKGAVQTVNSFVPCLALVPEQRELLWRTLMAAIASHQVGERPNRVEPRKLKNRKARYTYMTKPRNQERKRLSA
ncbi:MAG: IS4 family transposase [Terriglobia bacterium]